MSIYFFSRQFDQFIQVQMYTVCIEKTLVETIHHLNWSKGHGSVTH